MKELKLCSKRKASISTVITESVIMTIATDAKQERDIMAMVIPNAFVQTKVSQGDERIIMKIRGVLVDMLLGIDLENTKT